METDGFLRRLFLMRKGEIQEMREIDVSFCVGGVGVRTTGILLVRPRLLIPRLWIGILSSAEVGRWNYPAPLGCPEEVTTMSNVVLSKIWGRGTLPRKFVLSV